MRVVLARASATMLIVLLLAALVWSQNGTSNGTSSDTVTITLLQQQIKELQQHDRELEERLKALEGSQKPAVVPDAQPAETAAPASAAEIPPLSQTAPAAMPEEHRLLGIQWRGFGELDYKVLGEKNDELGTYGFSPGSTGNFYTSDFDLFLSKRYSDKASTLAEIAFVESDAQTFGVDLRRMLFKYDLNDHVRFSFGRYQTNIGYYNWAFRSASWLQTAADRPLVMEYASDGGLLPTQAIGFSVMGSIPSGKFGLNYVAEYGSSDTKRPDINGDGLLNDENNGNQINVGLFLTPDRIPGLRIGGSIYHDQISDLVDLISTGQYVGTQIVGTFVPSPSERWNQTIVNSHVVYVSHGIEFLNEGFLIRHAPIGPGETFNTPSFYSQFSKRIGPVRPYVRYQYTNASVLNPIYNDVGLRWGPSFGARYDVTEYCAFKLQLDHTARRGLPDLNGLHLQLSGTF